MNKYSVVYFLWPFHEMFVFGVNSVLGGISVKCLDMQIDVSCEACEEYHNAIWALKLSATLPICVLSFYLQQCALVTDSKMFYPLNVFQ